MLRLELYHVMNQGLDVPSKLSGLKSNTAEAADVPTTASAAVNNCKVRPMSVCIDQLCNAQLGRKQRCRPQSLEILKSLQGPAEFVSE